LKFIATKSCKTTNKPSNVTKSHPAGNIQAERELRHEPHVIGDEKHLGGFLNESTNKDV